MTLLKKGVSYGQIIISKMVFSCTKCHHIDIISEHNYNPSVEMICPKCNCIMILGSTNTDVIEEPNTKDISDKTST